jgi:uncharacterized protein YbjT (DUF2867 family)
MFIVMGATGHIGSAVAGALLDARQPVTVIVRDKDKGRRWESLGAQAAVADVNDPGTLREVFRRGKRAFLLNPPAAPSTDTDAVERSTAANILAALDDSGLERVVLESTYGARPGERIGDLSVLYEFEQGLSRQRIPATVLRAAYYMSNWEQVLDAARSGVLPTMFPADLPIPMVAAADVGTVASQLLLQDSPPPAMQYVEGPERYSPRDVARGFSESLLKPVVVDVTPRDQWQQAFRKLGFSQSAADSYARMTAAAIDEMELPADPRRGDVTLRQYIGAIAQASHPR